MNDRRSTEPAITERSIRWASTMGGHPTDLDGVRQAHAHGTARIAPGSAPLDRTAREAVESATLITGATLASGAGTGPARGADPSACFD